MGKNKENACVYKSVMKTNKMPSFGFIYPLSGSTAIDLGSFSSDLNSVFCMLPSKLANSMESLSAFVQ